MSDDVETQSHGPELFALIGAQKSIDKIAKGTKLPVGVEHVDMLLTLRVRGVLEKAKDVEINDAPKLDVPRFTAILLRKAKWSREQAAKLIAAALAESFKTPLPEQKIEDADREKDAEEAIAAARLNLATTKKQSGATTWKGNIEVLGAEAPKALTAAPAKLEPAQAEFEAAVDAVKAKPKRKYTRKLPSKASAGL